MTQKKCKLLFLLTVAFAIYIPVSYLASGDASRLITAFVRDEQPVSISIIETEPLSDLILTAQELLETTRVSEDGRDVPEGVNWVSAEVYAALQLAIGNAETTRDELDNVGKFRRGESFDMTVNIENNPGFATMPIQLHVPAGLELTHIYVDAFDGPQWQAPSHDPQGSVQKNPETTPVVGPDYMTITAFSIEDFTTQNVELMRFTFRVREDAALGETTTPITIDYRTVNPPPLGTFMPPTNRDGVVQPIALPGEGGVIGTIHIVE